MHKASETNRIWAQYNILILRKVIITYFIYSSWEKGGFVSSLIFSHRAFFFSGISSSAQWKKLHSDLYLQAEQAKNFLPLNWLSDEYLSNSKQGPKTGNGWSINSLLPYLNSNFWLNLCHIFKLNYF